jgi:hypothetical protein
MVPSRRHGKSPAWIMDLTLPFEHDQRAATSATRRQAGSGIWHFHFRAGHFKRFLIAI